MQTRCIKIDNITAGKEALHFAGELIRKGEVVAFPTETVYGLGANGLDAAACRKIYQAKGRPSDNPLILHVSNRSMIDQIAARIPEKAEKLIAAFCPGPITLILPRKGIVPEQITGGLSTVGVRMPEHDVARALIAAAGVPIAAPSANISGRPSPTTAESVLVDMEGKIPMILDGGACDFGVESTIVDATGEQAVILRPGAITKEMLEEVLGEGSVVIDPALVGADSVPKAPGMKYTHYAPKAPLTLIEGMPTRMVRAFRREIERLQAEGHNVGVLASQEVIAELHDLMPAEMLVPYGRQGNLPAIAANIYEGLRSFDDKEADMLLGEGTTSEGLGLAIMNRLHKASGFRTIQA
ncbi:L-threonylcarbamoyladenylate synthase [Selenomonas ruminantium]|uniref:Threonylcarbamoyl-AMP synthase n=1 Tax=Selenomonas ruminantium TaxID=971 RepID=A0A1M6SW12_SELRU|nr:L-threonylcarbamoyladenylate synthase [Selenomonas ruminantium]SHK48830.1 L-threonylcarbamoyladenylate synthase [Selenomonas ruminantium]